MAVVVVVAEDFVQEVTNIAKRITPSVADYLDESEAEQSRNDFRAISYLAHNEPARLGDAYFVGKLYYILSFMWAPKT